MISLRQTPDLPERAIPILSVGAGGIVENAHYPAYRLAGFPVAGVFDPVRERAERAAQLVGAPVVDSLAELVRQAPAEVIYDVAVPGAVVEDVLAELPDGAFVLIQKPLGETYAQAQRIVAQCEAKGLRAAVNFQLRWAPYMLALQDAVAQGLLGEVYELEFKINVLTPWANWKFLESAPRMEMVYHSIHYLDFIRHLWGEPTGVMALSLNDPSSPRLESTRSTISLNYDRTRRATVQTFHNHQAPPGHAESYCRLDGTQGSMWVQMGLNLNYPEGGPDRIEIWREGDTAWTEIPCEGGWFPHAFIGPMAAMMRWHAGGPAPWTEVHDSLRTMRLVETAYRCSDEGGRNPNLER